jgi:hypothetical protein
VAKFVPVPDVPKRFNEQLIVSATKLTATEVRGAAGGGSVFGAAGFLWASAAAEEGTDYHSSRSSRCQSLVLEVNQPNPTNPTNNRNNQPTTEPTDIQDVRALEDVAEWSVPDRQMRYGANEMRIPVKSVFKLIFDEMWHPFYVFQVCGC